MKTEPEHYVEAIRADMASRQFSVRHMAGRLGLSHHTLASWLSGRTWPRPSSYSKILAGLSAKQVSVIEAAVGLPDDYIAKFRRQAAAMVAAAPAVGPAAAAVADSARQLAESAPVWRTSPGAETAAPNLRTPQLADFAGGNLQPVRPNLVRVPVITMARAAGYRSAVGVAEFIDEIGDSELWEQVPDGHLLIRVDGRSLEPLMPNGTIIEVDTARWPRRGELAVAMIGSDETPIVKIYQRRDYVIALLPINEPDGRAMFIDLRAEDHETVHWIYPVVRYSAPPPTFPDQVDWAAAKGAK